MTGYVLRSLHPALWNGAPFKPIKGARMWWTDRRDVADAQAGEYTALSPGVVEVVEIEIADHEVEYDDGVPYVLEAVLRRLAS